MTKTEKKKKHRLFWCFFWIQFVLLILLLAAVGVYFFGGYAKQVENLKTEAVRLVRQSNEDTFCANQTSTVYAADGGVISRLKGEKDTYYLSIDEIPLNVTSAFVSIEDKKFYRHDGIDYKALLRAVKAMIKNGEVKQGGSTITMQLARNIFLSHEKTWQRKVEEMFIAVELEKKYSKDQILEFYLNNIYFGNGYYGIQAASRGYFNCGVQELSLSQIAFLSAIPNNPTVYDPITNKSNTLKRRNTILKSMLDDGKISKTRYSEARAETITLNRPEKLAKNDYVETYTYYCAARALMEEQGFVFQTTFDSDAEREAYEEQYSELYSECQKQLYTGGYSIYTSMDLSLQDLLQEAVDDTLSGFTEETEDGVYTLQASAVCIDNETGYVNAIVGGRSQDFSGYTLNRAFQSFRQPGSAIKPLIVYTPAFERNYTPDSVVVDQPIEDGPKNSNGKYLGAITVRTAVERSVNTIAWKLYEELTPQAGLSYLEQMNFAKLSSSDYITATALGGFTNGVSALEMAAGFAAIENDGNYRTPTCIKKILDADGNIVYLSEQEEIPVYKQNAARMMTDVLQGVISQGTAKGLSLGNMPSAGKTGTTNDQKDGWFVGYTRYYTTSVWVGYDMPKKMEKLMGSTYPGTIWQTFMKQIHENLEPYEFLPYVKVSGGVTNEVIEEEPLPEEEIIEGEVGIPEETAPEQTPQEGTPEQNVPEQTPQPSTPEPNVPEPSVPEQTPEQITPEPSVPEQNVPEQTPTESTPEPSVPEQNVPEQNVPEQITPEPSVPEQNIPEQTPTESTPEPSVPEQNIPQQTMPEPTVPEENIQQ